MLPLSPLRFSTIGKPILRTFAILKIFRFFDNSSRTRAKARATARARRTRARAKDIFRARARHGRTDGRTAGRSYLFSEMRDSNYLLQPLLAIHTIAQVADEKGPAMPP